MSQGFGGLPGNTVYLPSSPNGYGHKFLPCSNVGSTPTEGTPGV